MARESVKFYDFVRMGAVGNYSNCAPYSDFIEQNVNGVLLNNDPQKWIKTLAPLVNSGHKRQALANNVREFAYSLIKTERPGKNITRYATGFVPTLPAAKTMS